MKETPREVVEKLFEEEGYRLVGKEIWKGRNKYIYECDKGHINRMVLYSFKKGYRCPDCSLIKKSEGLRFSQEKARSLLKEQGCELLSDYKGYDKKVLFKCSCGKVSESHFSSIVKGVKCGCGYLSGPESPNWDHTKTREERESLRNYPEYKVWLKEVYARDDYTCQNCGERGGTLNAHHIIPYASNKELRTELSNGITFCSDCHRKFHRKYGLKRFGEPELKDFLMANDADSIKEER